MKLLFVASDRREYAGILSRANDVHEAKLAVKWVRSAKVGAHEALLVANGVGAKFSGAAVDAAAEWFRPEDVISTGFCGALDESLAVGDIVVADRVFSWGRPSPFVACPAQTTRNDGLRHGSILTTDHVVQTAGEKRKLRASGASAVEMEAAGVAERAAALGLPFYCIKAVTDLAGETMANDFNAALRADGHFDTMLILRRVLRRPTERLPELVRLRNRCARAARALGDFFADCRF